MQLVGTDQAEFTDKPPPYNFEHQLLPSRSNIVAANSRGTPLNISDGKTYIHTVSSMSYEKV